MKSELGKKLVTLEKLPEQTLIKELVRRIETGTIKIDTSFYDHVVGLSCKNYQ
jgi:hypothetical protein